MDLQLNQLNHSKSSHSVFMNRSTRRYKIDGAGAREGLPAPPPTRCIKFRFHAESFPVRRRRQVVADRRKARGGEARGVCMSAFANDGNFLAKFLTAQQRVAARGGVETSTGAAAAGTAQ